MSPWRLYFFIFSIPGTRNVTRLDENAAADVVLTQTDPDGIDAAVRPENFVGACYNEALAKMVRR